MSAFSSLPRDWIPTLVRFLQREFVVARVVVTEARGSTPREPGAFMLVGHDEVEGSIGGGRLEWEAIAAARELLADSTALARVNKVVLAADVGQCCGGVGSVWLERFSCDDLPVLRAAREAGARGPAVLVSEAAVDSMHRRVVRGQEATGAPGVSGTVRSVVAPGASRSLASTAISVEAPTPIADLLRQPRHIAHPVVLTNSTGGLTFIERLDDDLPSVWLYGAGHVGQALARILAELPLRLTWIDARAELFPKTLPDGVRILQDPDSVATVSEAPVGAYFVVMSHSHPLDYELCHALLERNDFAWLGLIGSESKAARFRSRLARTGLGREVIERLVCPIGVEGINSKWPAAIAVAVAAQLMQKISAAAEQPERLPAGAELQPSAIPAPLSPACSPELCATCGSAPDAPASSNNTPPTPRRETVTP